jgi:lipase
MTFEAPELISVPVSGGAITVACWGSGATPVLASHGITANHRSFAQVAAQLRTSGADVQLLAVDHRGRGGSAATPGPFGIGTHAQDLLAVLDHLAIDTAVLLGHSMGAFVAANAALLAPERVTGLVLIDGALPIEVDLPADAEIEDVVRAVIGPALDRLEQTFDSPEDYVAQWRAHPAYGGAYFNDVAEAHVRYDLIPTDDGTAWRSPVHRPAVLTDGADVLTDERVRTALARITTPTALLWAPRGMLDQEPGLFPPSIVEATCAGLEHVEPVLVEDVNHYSIVFSPHGAAAVAASIVAARRRTAG